MDWLTICIYAAGAILALAAIKFAWDLTIKGWALVGMTATTLAVGLQIAPGLYSGDRALAFLSLATARQDAKKIDSYREKVRKDIIARARMAALYPREVIAVNNFVRGN